MHLERLTMILEIVGQQNEATVADICAHTKLPKPSAYRLVQDLVSAGLLEPVGKSTFGIGTRLKRITCQDQSDRTLLELITPRLRQAAEQHAATFFLSRLRGREVEIIHVETPENGISYLHPGLGRRPLHACSCSKAIAAFLPEALLKQQLEKRLKAYTEFTLTSFQDLQAELAVIRQRGYAECVEEIELGMCSVASPVGLSETGKTLSIGATASIRVFNPTVRARIGKQLAGLGRQLSADIGWVQDEQATDARI